MTSYGIKVTKENKSVKSTNPLDISIDNAKPFLKTFKQGFQAVNVTGPGNWLINITHGLGYHPVYVHMTSPDPNFPERRYPGKAAANGPGGQIAIDSYITKEVLTLGWQDTSVAPGSFRTYPYTITFYYYIFYDKLE